MADPAADRPLAGLRVVDLADEKGELCGRLLADLGADVLRVEPPGGARSRTPPALPRRREPRLRVPQRRQARRHARPRGRRPAARASHELLASADVLLESFAPAERARLALDPGDRARAPPAPGVRLALGLRQPRALPRLGRHRRRARRDERHGLQGRHRREAAADPARGDRRRRGLVHRRLRHAARALPAPALGRRPAHRLLDAARHLADHRLVVLQREHPAQRQLPDQRGAATARARSTRSTPARAATCG